jgi:hypothetical protein
MRNLPSVILGYGFEKPSYNRILYSIPSAGKKTISMFLRPNKGRSFPK